MKYLFILAILAVSCNQKSKTGYRIDRSWGVPYDSVFIEGSGNESLVTFAYPNYLKRQNHSCNGFDNSVFIDKDSSGITFEFPQYMGINYWPDSIFWYLPKHQKYGTTRIYLPSPQADTIPYHMFDIRKKNEYDSIGERIDK